MESNLTWFASSLLVSVDIDVAGVVIFAVSVAVLAATTAEREWRVPSRVRAACLVSAGLLVATGFLHWSSRWLLALSCLGFLLSLEAVAVAFSRLPALGSYRDRRGAGADPGWWHEFEREFHRHLRRGGRDQNPLRGAVTRPRIREYGVRSPTGRRDDSPEMWS